MAQSSPVSVEDFYKRDLIVLVSEHYESTRPEHRRWQAWHVTARCYPFWFLEDKIWAPLNNQDYNPVPAAFLARQPQHLYIGTSSDGYVEISCHTPKFDWPGLYHVFGCKNHGRDEVLYCDSKDTYFKCLRTYQGQLAAIELLQLLGPAESS